MSEHKLQVQVARLLDHSGLLWTAIPNGGKRSAITGAILKAEGVKAGYPDILIDEPFVVIDGVWRSQIHGLRIELKNGKKGRTSEHQERWIQELRKRGYRAEVCRSMDEVMAVLRECYPNKFKP